MEKDREPATCDVVSAEMVSVPSRLSPPSDDEEEEEEEEGRVADAVVVVVVVVVVVGVGLCRVHLPIAFCSASLSRCCSAVWSVRRSMADWRVLGSVE